MKPQLRSIMSTFLPYLSVLSSFNSTAAVPASQLPWATSVHACVLAVVLDSEAESKAVKICRRSTMMSASDISLLCL